MNKTFNSNSGNLNACVGFNGNHDIDTYALGYYETVDVLIKSAVSEETTLDAVIYPIVYSARHYIELTLKHQIGALININRIVDPNFSSIYLSIHEISVLWEEFKKASFFDSRYHDLTKKADEFINDFSEIDDNGETFRYPFSNENVKHLTQLSHIGIIDLAKRFNELHEIFDEIVELTYQLVEEYDQKSFVGGKSRAEIMEIVHELPSYHTWKEHSFKGVKEKIKQDHSLSSNNLSKIIELIKSHREFSSIINNEIHIEEIESNDLKWFLNIYDEYLSNSNKYDYIEHLQNTTDKICGKLSKENIASIAQLHEMGWFRLYSEEYDVGLAQMMEMSESGLIRSYLLRTRNVKENIFRGLQILGQTTLMKIYD